MLKFTVILYLIVICVVGNKRDVYKIALSQRGYVQFLEYDIKTPPMKEFTFCTWLRILNLDNDQTIFSFIGKPYTKVIDVSLDAGGDYLKVKINDNLFARIMVEWRIHVWKHLCMSYQSTFGVWLIYIDGNLELCEVSESHVGFIIPGQGRILLGYGGVNAYGSNKGLEGEILSFYMILQSTIENKNTTTNNYKQTTRDKLSLFNDHFKYIVLGDLATAKSNNAFRKSEHKSTNEKVPPNHVRFSTRYSFVNHDVGVNKPRQIIKDLHVNDADEMEILDMPFKKDQTISFFKPINDAGNAGHFKKPKDISMDINSGIGIDLDVLPEISVFEQPPPPGATSEYDVNKNLKTLDYVLDELDDKVVLDMKNMNDKEISLLELETPPPIDKKQMVFGHWSTPNFADDVLKYLKTNNVEVKSKYTVPATISLTKISDSYPYSSEIRVKSIPFLRKARNTDFPPWHILQKYEINRSERNVQIEPHDIREDILKSHALTKPKQVTVIYRGDPIQNNNKYDKKHENEDLLAENSSNELSSPKPFKLNLSDKSNVQKKQNRFLKPLNISDNDNDMYLHSLLRGNNWHNVRSYNEHLPRFIHLESMFPNGKENRINELRDRISNDELQRGRQLAFQVANKAKISNKNFKNDMWYNENSKQTNFNRHVKIGNALDERIIIGKSEKENRQSFLGGDDRVPTINNYRSDNVHDNNMPPDIPASLKSKVCQEANVYNIPKSIFILRTNTSKQSAKALVLLSNDICASFEDLFLEAFIDWKRTPIRLFGGAHPEKAQEIC